LSFIASDELEGRATPSRGLDLAARYIASHLEFYGYEPAGEGGSFFQPIAVSRRKQSKDSWLRIERGHQRCDFQLGVDFLGSGYDAQGKLAFAGFGARSKEPGVYDDYDGLDVTDKLVVVLDGLPPGLDSSLFRPEGKWAIARERGARGTITIRPAQYTARSGDGQPSPFDSGVARLDRESLVFDFQETTPPFSIDLTDAAGLRLEQSLGIDLAAIREKITETKKPVAVIADASFHSEFRTQTLERLSTQNVIGFLEGSDPQLKHEIVAFSAHYDHLGTRDPAPHPPSGGGAAGDRTAEDRIYNGADDDGTGTVGILALAESFAAIDRPRRSLLFIWHAGEEKGLIGSDYYVRRPTKPLDQFACLINIDMIGRNFQDKEENARHVFMVGANRTSPVLSELFQRVGRGRLRLDESDPRGYYFRSDHFKYAQQKIPVAFFCTGEHRDYHRPSDEVAAIRFDKMKQVLDIIFEAGLELANRNSRPDFVGP
jgi:hypothetical protein